MAVYTDVSPDDLTRFVARFDIGDVVTFEGIAQGTENTNYRLQTTAGLYVVTLYEKRVDPGDLPFFLGLMRHLAEAAFPCPAPIPDRQGEILHDLSGRPAAVVAFAPGDWPREITAAHCRKVGTTLARLHQAAADYSVTRRNDQGLSAWRSAFPGLAAKADELRPGLSDWIAEELGALEAHWPNNLPSGLIHGDLFPDNVFFQDGDVSGVIDFYFACADTLSFDLAICLNAWCFEDGGLDRDRAHALSAGYQSIRRLDPAEQSALPLLARGAAMRFLMTRLHDWFYTPENTLARRKDPLELVPVIEFHRAVSDSTAYGVG